VLVYHVGAVRKDSAIGGDDQDWAKDTATVSVGFARPFVTRVRTCVFTKCPGLKLRIFAGRTKQSAGMADRQGGAAQLLWPVPSVCRSELATIVMCLTRLGELHAP
jgi:hypothetical protein